MGRRKSLIGLCTLLSMLMTGPSKGHAQEREKVVEATAKCANDASYPVHLTFDDGPRIPETEEILDTLKSFGAKATFFITTSRFPNLAAGRPPGRTEQAMLKVLDRMRREGHTIGTHSFEHIEHANHRKVSESQALLNIAKDRVVAKALNLSPPIPFRFPYGSGWFADQSPENQNQADFMMQHLKKNNYLPVHWDIDSWDWSKIKRKALPHSILHQICTHAGGIVLMHDIHKFTAENLKTILLSIKKSNHRFVSLEETSTMRLASLQNRAVSAAYCGQSAGGLDSVWPSCEVYTKKSSDLGTNQKGVAR